MILPINHIVEGKNGQPWVADTDHSVAWVVAQTRQRPIEAVVSASPALTHAKVHAALAYYYDHQDAIDLPAEVTEAAPITPPVTPQTHMTTKEAAEALGLRNPSSIREMIGKGDLEGIKWPPDATHRATWYVSRKSVKALLNKRRQQRREGRRGRPPKLPEDRKE